MTSRTENVLLGTLQDLQIQCEVEQVMKEMLVDVELAATLNRDLALLEQQAALQEEFQQWESALQEARLVEQQENKDQMELANHLLKEMYGMSQQVASLKRWKRQHEHAIGDYDEIVAKLLQAQDEIQHLQSGVVAVAGAGGGNYASPPEARQEEEEEGNAQKTADEGETTPPKSELKENTDNKNTNTNNANNDNVRSSASKGSLSTISAESSPKESSPPTEQTQTEAATRKESAKDPAPVSAVEEVSRQQSTNETDQPQTTSETTQQQEQQQEPPAVVALLSEDEETPTLETLDVPVLLELFTFLDAVDILNLAQVNIGFYSRVDSLFGAGATIPEQEQPPVPTEVSTPPPQAAAPAAPPAAQVQPQQQKQQPQQQHPQQQKQPQQQQQQQQQPPPATVVQLPPTPEPVKPKRMGLFSMLQPVVPSAANTKPPAASKPPPPPPVVQQQRKPPAVASRPTQQQQSQKQALTPAMASSMTAKLNDAEINAIVSMTEKLRQTGAEVASLTKKNQELAGKLNGTESVKEFLIVKVRELELTLGRNKDSEAKLTQQIASDQEVIAFLDGRVQELEQGEVELSSQVQDLTASLKQQQTQNEQKVTVLSDMLQFEREKLAETEGEWKSAKKVLVKEVKHCRAQIVALQAERDGLREQNRRLEKAVVASNVGMNGNGTLSPSRAFLATGR